ncbi:MAG: hypothetical protein ACLGIF_04355, partial [Actinomycetes bacterium]
MAALLVRLKLTLLRNTLRRSVWRTVGLVLGLVYGLAVVVAALAGLVALRFTGVALTADVTVLAFAALTLGWLLMSLLVFGVDETVDPSRFALLPVRARELLPGLLVAGLVGTPGMATVLVAAGLVAAWSRSVPLVLVTLLAIPFGVATCVLLSRAGTAAFASFLSSRRFRDLAFLLLAFIGVGFALVGNVLGGAVRLTPDQLRGVLSGAATVAAWTPFGWAWAVPADVARGAWLTAGIHLLLAVILVGALWRTWEHVLARQLVQPVEGSRPAGTVRGPAVERLYPSTPAGGVAARALRYWRRDPRYLAGMAGLLIGPIVIMVSVSLDPDADRLLVALAPVLLSALLGVVVAQDLAYDGSAVWQHVASGITGRDDRLGRVLAVATIFGPVLVLLVGVGLAVSGRWSLAPLVLGLAVGVGLVGLGVGSVVGALWQWPAPPPGANPFSKGNSGGLPGLLSLSVSSVGTLLLSLPVLALALGAV